MGATAGFGVSGAPGAHYPPSDKPESRQPRADEMPVFGSASGTP